MADITVRPLGEGRFRVTLTEGAAKTEHEVKVGADDLERLGGGYGSADEFVRACFAFLLERETKEQILRTFDVAVIGRYFPEFEDRIRRG